MSHSDVLVFRLLPEPHVCRAVREGVREFAVTHEVDPIDLENLQAAIGEALANAIEHGRCEAPIEVEVVVTQEMIVATIRDRGVGFPSEYLHEAALPDAGDERGRGVPIMRRCSDFFGVTSEPGDGTMVRLGRYRRTLPGSPADLSEDVA